MKLIKNLQYKKILSLFLKQDGTPFFNAKGVAVGVFCGCFPFFGFQTLLGLFLARVAKGNLFLAAIGTWISNPFTYVPLYFFNYKVGSFLLKNSPDIVFDKNLMIEELWEKEVFFIKVNFGFSISWIFISFYFRNHCFLLYKRKIKKQHLKILLSLN